MTRLKNMLVPYDSLPPRTFGGESRFTIGEQVSDEHSWQYTIVLVDEPSGTASTPSYRLAIENDAAYQTFAPASTRVRVPRLEIYTWSSYESHLKPVPKYAVNLRGAFREVVPSASAEPMRTVGEDLEIREQQHVIAEFLDDLEKLSKDNSKVDDAIDEVIDYFDTAMHDEAFELCNRTLEYTQPERVSVEALLSMLSMTFAIREALPGRKAFIKKVRTYLNKHRGPDVTSELLHGLE